MMLRRRILVYSENHAAATMQIRLVGPLVEHGLELIDAHDFFSATNLNATSQSPRDLASMFDAVIVHRGIKKRCPVYSVMIATAHKQRVPVIIDIDDLLFGVPRTHPDFSVYQSRTAQALKAILDADTVVASTQPLADQISAFHPSVVVIHNELPRGLWSEVCRRKQTRPVQSEADPVTIGYIGSETHRPDLQSVEDVLLKILRENRDRVRFLSVGVPLSPQLRREPNAEQIIPSKRIIHGYPDFIPFAAALKIDIGIAPLLNNPFNCCKSNVKFLEYTALGIAGVYSDLPTYRVGVRHEENGLLAASLADWQSSLERLVSSSELRECLAKTAARDLEAAWQQPKAGALWTATVEMALAKVQSRAGDDAHSIAAIVGNVIDYQTDLERLLKQSVRYQARRIFSRLLRKWAA